MRGGPKVGLGDLLEQFCSTTRASARCGRRHEPTNLKCDWNRTHTPCLSLNAWYTPHLFVPRDVSSGRGLQLLFRGNLCLVAPNPGANNITSVSQVLKYFPTPFDCTYFLGKPNFDQKKRQGAKKFFGCLESYGPSIPFSGSTSCEPAMCAEKVAFARCCRKLTRKRAVTHRETISGEVAFALFARTSQIFLESERQRQ